MSDQEPYTGICIGGPHAGVRVTHTTPHFAMAERKANELALAMTLHGDSHAPVIKTHNYRYYGHMFVDGKDVQSFPMWLHDSIKNPSDAFALMAAAYIKQTRQDKRAAEEKA